MNCIENYLNSPFLKSEKPAVVFFKSLSSLSNKKSSISFNKLFQNSIRAQKLLQANDLGRNSTILLFEAPTPDLYAVILAALGLGVKMLIVEPWMKANKINSILKKTSPQAMLTGVMGKAVLMRATQSSKIKNKFSASDLHSFDYKEDDSFHVEQMDGEDHAILTFTTGTSGDPKGVHRKHQYLLDQASVLRNHLEYDENNKLDLTVFTNVVLLNLSLGKGSLIIPPNWNEETIKALDDLPKEYEVDTLASGPAFLLKLMKLTKRVNLKSLHLGGALTDNWIYEMALDKWPDADFHHVYGSTEAEPVALGDLRVAVNKSKEKGYFQTLFLGNPIDEIKTEIDNTLWVSGPHVSPMYDNDPSANEKNKKLDSNDITWHNMGDRILDNDGLWYKGRDFQSLEDFELEQGVYSLLNCSKSFVKKINNRPTLFGENVEQRKTEIIKKYPEFANIIDRKIIRDVRHKARIDRDKSFIDGVRMKNIMVFIKERVPVIANIILGVGLVYSAAALLNISIPLVDSLFMIIGLLIFITELRFMDELKDYEKDMIAHPTRPLPAGVVTKKQVNGLIIGTFIALMVWSALSFVLYGQLAGAFLSITTLWLFLMYKEFFIGESLSKSPIIYAITHQVIILPVCFYVISIIDPVNIYSTKSLGFCLLVLSSFFSFEVGRKMDPNAHEVLGTYLVHYKKIKTNILITFLMSVGLVGAVLLDRIWWVAIPFALIILTQLRVYFQESRFKDLEGLIALNLIYNLWFLIVARWIS